MRFRKNKYQNAWVSLEEHSEEASASCSEIGARSMNLSGPLDRIDLQTAIDMLPNGYRTTFVLHDIQGYDHHEIAKMFGRSAGNSKSQLHKARVRLRKLLSGINPRH
jgi:RNA polymerase sigma-70 factor (ECF subfamily)